MAEVRNFQQKPKRQSGKLKTAPTRLSQPPSWKNVENPQSEEGVKLMLL